ncbi:polyphenol oxidase family protein [Pseudomonas entomophila]|uniref:polyphenol oxidase family protein n=1 Tax=Pseudomonas sp. RIT-PI-S TaxID=3035295 RepID=UPI0021D9D4D8
MVFISAALSNIRGVEHGFGTLDDKTRPPDLLYPDQQHGAGIVEAQGNEMAKAMKADALFTRSTRAIGVITADCLPLLVASTQVPFVATIHAGWKGLVAGCISNSIRAFVGAGIDTQALRFALGPSIGSCCYEVSLSLLRTIEAAHGHIWEGREVPWSWAQPAPAMRPHLQPAAPHGGDAWLDLRTYCQDLLMFEGIARSQIDGCAPCTYCSTPTLGSYRRRQQRAEGKAFQYSWIRLTGAR